MPVTAANFQTNLTNSRSGNKSMSEYDNNIENILQLKKEMSEHLARLNRSFEKLQEVGVIVKPNFFTDTSKDGTSNNLTNQLDVILTIKI